MPGRADARVDGVRSGLSVVQVVPLTSRVRGHLSEVTVEPDEGNGLAAISAAQCQHVRASAVERFAKPIGHVGAQTLSHIREIVTDLFNV
jgi:mRNA interferase MazF